MTREEFLARFGAEASGLSGLVARKNQKYGSENDALASIETAERLTNGKITRETGLLVRMGDKYGRLVALLTGGEEDKEESALDTARDLAAYALILAVCLQERAPVPARAEKQNPLARLFSGIK